MTESSQYLMMLCAVPKELVEWQSLETMAQMGFAPPPGTPVALAAGLLTEPWKTHPKGSALFIISQSVFYIVNPPDQT
jgi:hypothetical protein